MKLLWYTLTLCGIDLPLERIIILCVHIVILSLQAWGSTMASWLSLVAIKYLGTISVPANLIYLVCNIFLLSFFVGTASKADQDQTINDVPPQLNRNVPKICDLEVPSEQWNKVHLPVDSLLFTVKDCEFLSSYSYLKNPFRSYNKELGYVYFGKMGHQKVALVRCQEGSAAPGGSTIAAKNAITKLRPKANFVVGVCSALSPTKANLGDVVISSNLAMHGQKIVTNEGVQLCGIRTPVSRDFSCLIRNAADGWKAPLQDPHEREVKVHRDSVILSGPETVKSRQRCKELIQSFPDAIAIETEGEGEIKLEYEQPLFLP